MWLQELASAATRQERKLHLALKYDASFSDELTPEVGWYAGSLPWKLPRSIREATAALGGAGSAAAVGPQPREAPTPPRGEGGVEPRPGDRAAQKLTAKGSDCLL